MNDIVKYHNKLNEIHFPGFSSSDYDLFMVICSKLKGQGSKEVRFEYTELRTLANYSQTNNRDLFNSLQNKIRQMAQTVFEIRHGDLHSTVFPLFRKFENDGNNGFLVVSVSAESQYLLNDLTANFTRFELEEFVSLKTKYQKTLYRLLKQFRTTGDLTISAEDFRMKLDIPKSYQSKDIVRKIIKPTVDALKEFIPDLDYVVLKSSKRGAPVRAYRFSFSQEAPDRQRTIEEWQKDSSKKGKQNPFLNIQNHEYDFDQLEKELLENGPDYSGAS